jgi:hypothetical protein
VVRIQVTRIEPQRPPPLPHPPLVSVRYHSLYIHSDPRYELKALELLGKHSDIGIFTERSEITINYKNPEELEKAIKERVKNLLNATVVETVSLDDQLGVIEDNTQTRLDDALGVLGEDIEDVDVEAEDDELNVSV